MPEPVEFEIKLNRRQVARLTHTGDVGEAMRTAGYYVEGEAKRRVRVRTGNLRRSIYSETERDFQGWVTRVGTNVKYGLFQELGTVNHPPFPYLRPAVAALQQALRRGSLR